MMCSVTRLSPPLQGHTWRSKVIHGLCLCCVIVCRWVSCFLLWLCNFVNIWVFFRFCSRSQLKVSLREFLALLHIKWARWTCWTWALLLLVRSLCPSKSAHEIFFIFFLQGTPSLFLLLLLFNNSMLPAYVESERRVRCCVGQEVTDLTHLVQPFCRNNVTFVVWNWFRSSRNPFYFMFAQSSHPGSASNVLSCFGRQQQVALEPSGLFDTVWWIRRNWCKREQDGQVQSSFMNRQVLDVLQRFSVFYCRI